MRGKELKVSPACPVPPRTEGGRSSPRRFYWSFFKEAATGGSRLLRRLTRRDGARGLRDGGGGGRVNSPTFRVLISRYDRSRLGGNRDAISRSRESAGALARYTLGRMRITRDGANLFSRKCEDGRSAFTGVTNDADGECSFARRFPRRTSANKRKLGRVDFSPGRRSP